MTITTVGYGDYTPKTIGGRVTFVLLSEISLNVNEKVIAVYKNGEFIFGFTPDVVLEEGDYLLVIASPR